MNVLRQLYLPTTGTGYSYPVEMGPYNAIAVSCVIIFGTAAGTVSVEGSNDLTNWGTGGISGAGFSTGTAPNASSALFTSVAYKYVRVKVLPSTGPLLVNIDAAPYVA